MGRSETGTGPVGATHVSVLEGLVVWGLRPRPGARLVDATLGLGGHAAALLRAADDTALLGVDQDPDALALAATRLAPYGARAQLARGSFAELPRMLAARGWDGVDGILLDLGVSSLQLDRPGRGFSFRTDGPLDMRMDPDAEGSAADVVNAWPVEQLTAILAEYGEERRARAVAHAIVRARPLHTTAALADVVRRVVPSERPGFDPATRTFQAIRIAVNDELGALDAFLATAPDLLRPGGRLAVLSYHSLEDRRVKEAFRRWAATCLCPPGLPTCVCGWKSLVRLITRRPRTPDAAEIAKNPRARSAKLRVVERLGGDDA
jgi:16S rRNA (cytosine1402-N4)-methyltransferase